MGYKSKGGKLVRAGKPTLTLYHFTSPYHLPSILQDGIVPCTREGHEHMLPGVDAVWLTNDPEGNTIKEAHLELYRKCGQDAICWRNTQPVAA